MPLINVRRSLVVLLMLLAAAATGVYVGRVTAPSNGAQHRADVKKHSQLAVTEMTESEFLSSLGYKFVDKAVGQLHDGEAGWTTSWSLDGSQQEAYATKDLGLEADGPFGTVHMLIGREDGRYVAVLFRPPRWCGGDDDSGPSGSLPDVPSVQVTYRSKHGPCPYTNIPGYIGDN
jgi:hypothetical protein